MKRKFYLKNFFFIALPTVLVILLLGCMILYLSYSTSKREVMRIEEHTVSRIKESLEVLYSEADAQSLNYSEYPNIMLKLKSLLQYGYIDKVHMDINYVLLPFLNSSVNSKPFLHSIYLYLENDNGNFFASGVGLANRSNHGDYLWLENLPKPEEITGHWFEERTISRYSMSSYTTDVITLYKPLYGSIYTKAIGVIVLNMEKDYLERFIRDSLTYEKQSFLLIDSDGTVLCQVGEDVAYDSNHADKLESEYFVVDIESTGYGIHYISLIPRNVVLEVFGAMLQLIAMFLLLSLAIGMILAFMVTMKNARNVQRVIEIFESAKSGETLPVLDKTKDEYSFIIQNIITNFIEKNYLKMQLEHVSFSFLQSQLNPHFLFNTLKNIFWKTVKLTGSPNEASQMIDKLTNLLQYTLVNPNKYVKIKDEIKMTACYVDIQQMRFDYNLLIEKNYAPEIEAREIIKFVFQPLVENSISHGITNVEEKLKLMISIQEKDNRLYFSVTDNGAGFTPERLEEIKKRLKNEESPVRGIGLYNLNKRLILTYGAESNLQIASVPDEETIIFFSVPIRETCVSS